MATNLRTRSQSARVFLLSGLHDAERKELAKSITSLGGIYFDTESFRANCTHVVCGKLTRSEKFLGACASGKWVLHPHYIRDSAMKGEWLEESLYDWSNIKVDADISIKQMREAPRRWRYYVEAFGTSAFTGWKTAVVVNGLKKNSVYKRLLQSGGAEVFNLKLPVKQPEKEIAALAYIFVSDKFASQVCHLMEFGVLCIKPEYIGDFLIKDPAPDPLDYLVKTSDTSLQDLSTNSDSFVTCSQDDINTSQIDEGSTRTPELLPLSQGSCPRNSSKPVSIKKPLTRSRKSIIPVSPLTRNHGRSGSSSAGCSRVASPCTTRSDCLVTVSSSNASVIASSSTAPAKPTAKRKLSNLDVEYALKELKKQKVSDSRYTWKSTVPVFSIMDDNKQVNDAPLEFSDSMTGLIYSCLEEDSSATDFMTFALDLVTSILNNKRFPKASTVHFILTKILQSAKKPILASKAYTVLMRLLTIHPPVTPTLVKLYVDALIGQRSTDRGTEDIPFGHRWEFIKSVIANVLHEPAGGYSSPNFEQTYQNNIFLLKFIVGALEVSFKSGLQCCRQGGIHKLMSTLLAQVLWQSIYQVNMNTRCLELISLFGDCLSCSLDDFKKTQVLGLLVQLVSMCVECCNLVETPQAAIGYVRVGQKTSMMIHEIARKIDVGHLDNHLLRYTLRCLQPSWVCLHVCYQLLNSMDDYLVLEGIPKEENASLKAIVSRYFFMLPKLQVYEKQMLLENKQQQKRLSKDRSAASGSQKTDINMQEMKENVFNKSFATRASKKNTKGETPLHIACIKNDVMKVKQLLQVPGVDVNAKDNVGWTPLHEACNHGNLQCVRELLDFVPAKTVEHYFSKGQKCRKADLLQASEAGITPLHDAVMNNRLDVCQLLLNHGGSKLLCCRTVSDQTPIDFAVTEEMRSVLLSYQNDHLSNSQGSESSQEVQPPSNYLYDQVLGKDGQKRFSNKDECSKYISIVTSTVRAYLDATHVQSVQRMLNKESIQHSCGDSNAELINGNCDSQVSYTSNEVVENTEEDIVFICSQGLKQDSTGKLKETANSVCNNSDITQFKSDLNIVKKLGKYISRFENHVLRISYPEHHTQIRTELIGLQCIAENASLFEFSGTPFCWQ